MDNADKLISFAVPSYNSEKYISHCIDTLVSAGEDVEVLIINDGSTDSTARIANDYAEKYPKIVRAIHKENGGHGSGVNRGLLEAKGIYYKVVDSDDWVNKDALRELIALIKKHKASDSLPDMYIANFVYDKVDENKQFIRNWKKHLPSNVIFDWNDVGKFKRSEAILMHSVIYKTDVLRRSDTILPEHTFYVDNYFVYKPMPFMKSIYYIDVDLYHYYIGREDQSVNIKNFSRRYEQQMRVMKLLVDAYSYDEIMEMPEGLKKYFLHYLSLIMLNTITFCVVGGSDKKRKADLKELWEYIKVKDIDIYKRLRRHGYCKYVNWMPWQLKRFSTYMGYKFYCATKKVG